VLSRSASTIATIIRLAALTAAALGSGAVLGCEDGAVKAKGSVSKSDAVTLQKSADSFYQANARCPNLAELNLPKEFAAKGANDAWGNPFKVVCTGSDVRVVSAGADKREGTADDVSSK
jgi:general secretion pathway protein G